MIAVYSWPNLNGDKIHIMLEERGLPHRVIPVNIGSGAQFDHNFAAFNPNRKLLVSLTRSSSSPNRLKAGQLACASAARPCS